MKTMPMPDLKVWPYPRFRPMIRPGMIAFFSQDTSGLKKCTPGGFASWRIKRDQRPPHECTHCGVFDVVRDRVILVHATSPRVEAAPFSAFIGETTTPDGKHLDPYHGSVYVAKYDGCDADAAAGQAWNNLLLPYDYLDLAAIRIGTARHNTKRYICSEHVAECLLAGRTLLAAPANGWGWTPADLILDSRCHVLWRAR